MSTLQTHLLLAWIVEFPLVANGQNPNLVLRRKESVQGEVPRVAKRDHQLPNRLFHNPADMGMPGQDRDRVNDRRRSSDGRQLITTLEKLEQALYMVERVCRINYLRHGAGRGGFSPLASRPTQAWTSSAL